MMGSDVARKDGKAARTTQPAVRISQPVARASQSPVVPPLEPPPTPARALPERPKLGDKEHPPVLVKLPPPFTVRVAQLSWILSFAVSACAVVYLFIIRKAQLPDIANLVKKVDDTRPEGTIDSATDIVFWAVFGGVVAVLFVQIAMLVAFSNRRPHVRWYLLATLFVQSVVLVFARELVAIGDRGRPAELLLIIALGLALLGMGFSVLPPALRWTARRHDVRRGPAP